MKQQTVYVLMRDGKNTPVQYGSKTEICNAWCRKRYQNAPDENFSVFEAKVLAVKKLFKDEIETIVEEYYR